MIPLIRPAQPNDARAWLDLRQALWPTGNDDHEVEIASYFEGTLGEPSAVLLAFDQPGNAIGLAELSIRPYAEGCATKRVAYLEGWYVVPTARRLGVGRALVGASEEWGRSMGCSEFASDAQLDNEPSATAHRALGFAEVGLIRCFRKNL